MKEKKTIGFYLDIELIRKFRLFVANQYGGYHQGNLSFEAGQALQSWMSAHQSTQTALSQNHVNPIPTVYRVKEQVKNYLISQFGYDSDSVYKIPKKHLIIAIGSIRGTDHRTVKKWLKLFEQYGVVKWITPGVLEFI